MANSRQISGMRGVYMVAAELSRLGFIVSPTLRNVQRADLLVTDQLCKRAFSVQVKTNAKTFNFWLLNKKAKELISPSHIYVLVNIRKDGDVIDYFVTPSKVISKKMVVEERKASRWYSFSYEDAKPYLNNWKIFGNP